MKLQLEPLKWEYVRIESVLNDGGLSLRGGILGIMNRLDLQPGIAHVGITAAQWAGEDAAAFEVAGPIATGTLSIIDAAAGVADFTAIAAQGSRASALLTHIETLTTAAAAAVDSLVAIDESNAAVLRAVAE
ncbi:hypothetical protein [Mycobacterium sp. 852013-51886_SCH5428379]|uniref:hypothetical protein n=1 Tax=Mycobacterium sp. 852013-51886_SCH5428379 TaxID=1834111 RepID=UPI001E37E397|nr:hypothetical protein [Mycobacterium sp. 852013-51886_SCH5428379]